MHLGISNLSFYLQPVETPEPAKTTRGKRKVVVVSPQPETVEEEVSPPKKAKGKKEPAAKATPVKKAAPAAAPKAKATPVKKPTRGAKKVEITPVKVETPVKKPTRGAKKVETPGKIETPVEKPTKGKRKASAEPAKKSHFCKICDKNGKQKTFAIWNSLVNHVKKVHKSDVKSEKPRKKPNRKLCWICDKELKGSLSEHLYKKHQIEDRIVELTKHQKKDVDLDPLPRLGTDDPMITDKVKVF